MNFRNVFFTLMGVKQFINHDLKLPGDSHLHPHMPVISATQESKAGGSQVQGQPREFRETLSHEKFFQKGLGM